MRPRAGRGSLSTVVEVDLTWNEGRGEGDDKGISHHREKRDQVEDSEPGQGGGERLRLEILGCTYHTPMSAARTAGGRLEAGQMGNETEQA